MPARYTDGAFSSATSFFVLVKNVSIELLRAVALPYVLVIFPAKVMHSFKSDCSSGFTTTALIPSSSSVSAAFFNFIGRNTTSGAAATHASVLNSFAVPILGRFTAEGAASLYIFRVFAFASIPTSLSVNPSAIRRLVEI